MMQGPVHNMVINNGASAVITAAVFLAMQLAFRVDLVRAPRWSDVTDQENEFTTRYFGRIN